MLNRYSTSRVWRSTFPQVEAVTLRSRTAADQSAFTDYPIGHAKQRPIDSAPSSLAGNMVEDVRCKWQIWADAIAYASAPDPKEGDAVLQTLQDGSQVTWYVERLGNKLFNNVFDLFCLRQAQGAA